MIPKLHHRKACIVQEGHEVFMMIYRRMRMPLAASSPQLSWLPALLASLQASFLSRLFSE